MFEEEEKNKKIKKENIKMFLGASSMLLATSIAITGMVHCTADVLDYYINGRKNDRKTYKIVDNENTPYVVPDDYVLAMDDEGNYKSIPTKMSNLGEDDGIFVVPDGYSLGITESGNYIAIPDSKNENQKLR